MFSCLRFGKSPARSRRNLLLEELESRTLLSASPVAALLATPQVALVNNYLSTVSAARHAPSSPTVTNPIPVGGFNPSQASAAYDFQGNGTGQTIAIVDAYHDPNIAGDLATFDTQYGVAAPPSFTVLNQSGSALYQNGQSTGVKPPATDGSGGWALEESLDVEWAHAMAPGANIVVVEANTQSASNLFTAVQTAASPHSVVVAGATVTLQASVVSMSWGFNEASGETAYDKDMTQAGVTYVAASGDSGAPAIYPAVSPNVVSVGGTTLTLDANNNIASEVAWGGSGGGISKYEAQPSGLPTTYTNGIQSGISDSKLGSGQYARMSPDVAYDGNPNTGFAVYDSVKYYPYYPFTFFGYQNGWFEVGGTSAGAPQWSALVAIANQGRQLAGSGPLSGASQTLPALYGTASAFHDITSGTTTGSPQYTAGSGYDLATGLGSPQANAVVSALVSVPSTSPLAVVATATLPSRLRHAPRQPGPPTHHSRGPGRQPHHGSDSRPTSLRRRPEQRILRERGPGRAGRRRLLHGPAAGVPFAGQYPVGRSGGLVPGGCQPGASASGREPPPRRGNHARHAGARARPGASA
jgi:subtilase family serine protease